MRRALLSILLLGLLGLAGWGLAWASTGAQVGAGFAAKVACSLVHLSRFDKRHVVDDYIA